MARPFTINATLIVSRNTGTFAVVKQNEAKQTLFIPTMCPYLSPDI